MLRSKWSIRSWICIGMLLRIWIGRLALLKMAEVIPLLGLFFDRIGVVGLNENNAIPRVIKVHVGVEWSDAKI